MFTPRCPCCNAQGLDRFRAVEIDGQFRLVCCCQCGAVLGVLPVEKAPLAPLAEPPIEASIFPPQQAEPGFVSRATPPAPPIEVQIPLPRQVEPAFTPPSPQDEEILKRINRNPLTEVAAVPPLPEQPKPFTKDQIAAFVAVKGMYHTMLAFDAPFCPKCHIERVEEKVPEDHKEAGQVLLCP